MEQALKRIKELGLRNVEFSGQHLPATADKDKIAAVLKLCKEYEITPLAWGVLNFTKDTDANRKIFESGKALGVKMFSAKPTEDSFDSLDKLVDEYKIAIGIHPHGPVGAKGKEKLDHWYCAEVIMAAVPLDPEDGEPLGYRRYEDRVVVYSRAEYSGFLTKPTVFDPDKLSPPGEGVAFHLFDVKHRRQPPRPKPVIKDGDLQ